MHIICNYNDVALQSKLFEIINAIDAVIYDSEEYYNIRDYSVNNSDSELKKIDDNTYIYNVYHNDDETILYYARINIIMHNLSDVDYSYNVYTRLSKNECDILEKYYHVCDYFAKHTSVYK